MWQMKTFLDDSHQHASAVRDPDLHLHRVLAGAQKCLGAQMLLDPFEEQPHLPALAVQIGNQMLGEVGVNLTGLGGIRVGQGVAQDRLTAKRHVVQPLGLRAQVDLGVAQGELGKGHSEELVRAREVLDLVIASMGGHAAAKGAQWQIGHERRKHELSLVNGGPSRWCAKDQKSAARRSNRD